MRSRSADLISRVAAFRSGGVVSQCGSVVVAEVVDPRELELPDVGVITMVDPETGRRREVSTGDPRLRRRFAEAAAAQRVRLAEALRRCGAAHLALRTDRDFTTDIVRHVHAQRRLALASYARSPGGRPV